MCALWSSVVVIKKAKEANKALHPSRLNVTPRMWRRPLGWVSFGVHLKDDAGDSADCGDIFRPVCQQHGPRACVRGRLPIRPQKADSPSDEVHCVCSTEHGLSPAGFRASEYKGDAVAVVVQLAEPPPGYLAVGRIQPDSASPRFGQPVAALIFADVPRRSVERSKTLCAWVEVERPERRQNLAWREPCVGLAFVRHGIAREKRR